MSSTNGNNAGARYFAAHGKRRIQPDRGAYKRHEAAEPARPAWTGGRR